MAKRIVARSYGEPSDVLQFHEVDIPAPGPGQVTMEVKAAGVNPADAKAVQGRHNPDPAALPLPIGFEAAGVITAIGPDTRIATGSAAIGEAVLAYPLTGAYAEAMTINASDVFAKPQRLTFEQASGLLLAGATAADMLRVVPVGDGDTVVAHGASGGVGTSLLQQLALTGAHVIGTGRADRLEAIEEFGATPVTYGPGLLARLQEAAPKRFTAAFDCSGDDGAIDASLELVGNPARIVSIAAFARAGDGIALVSGTGESADFRASVRPTILALADEGKLSVPMDRFFPLAQAGEALEYLAGGQAHGKLALIP